MSTQHLCTFLFSSHIHYKIPHRFIGYIKPITESMKNSPPYRMVKIPRHAKCGGKTNK